MGLLAPDPSRELAPQAHTVPGAGPSYNVTRLSRLLRILRFHAHDLKLTPSVSVDLRWGKVPKQRLRFIKVGGAKSEEGYASHFV
jgi:hypothetical protein